MNSIHVQCDLYATPMHECAYLPERTATTVFADPLYPKDASLYNTLSKQGFRRSGEYLYCPQCANCQACISVRIPVNAFKARRSQRRVWKNNQDIIVTAKPPIFEQAHFDLYQRYIGTRHKNGGMDGDSPESYIDFLSSTWANTIFFEFKLDKHLVGVAIVDVFEDSMSAVYTFFDPDYEKRSLGVYAILWEIEKAKKLRLKYLYLGYWIQACRKMRYKTDYQPLEYFVNNHWQLEYPY